MAFIIRNASEADLPEILLIYNTEILQGFATWNEQAYSLEKFQKKLADIQARSFPFLVAADSASNRVAGYADYTDFRSFTGYRHTVEHSVFIDRSYARQGVGKLLLQHLINHAQRNQVDVMIAGIDHDNTASIALHQKLGFIQTGYMPQVGKKFDQWRDLVLMQLTFSTDPAP